MRHVSSGLYYIPLLLSFLSTVALGQGLSAPTLQATADGSTVALQWTDAEGYSSNHIERKSGGSDWTLVAETGQANSYWDRSTVSGVTYTYRVQAITLDGRFTYSNEASATTDGPTLEPPYIAPRLSAEPLSHTSVRLRWNDIAGETQYIIQRGHPGQWVKTEVLPANTTEYIDTGLTPASQYFYRIRAWNHAGFSPDGAALTTTLYDPNIIPPVPSLHAYPYTDTAVTLLWNYVPQATGYRVESKTGPTGPWIEFTNVTMETGFIIHENLSPSTDYSYRMRAYNGAGISDYSAEMTTSTYPPPPSSPQLRGIPVSYKEIELRWTDVLTNCCTTPGYIGYRLEAWNGSGWTDLWFGGVDETNYFVRGLRPATEYTYRIAAQHPLPSEWSTNTVRTMDPPPIAPNVPIFFADRYSSTAIDLKWIDVELETEYRIERENFPGGGVWKQIAVVPADSTRYRDTGLQSGTLYVYRIRAANSFGASPYSDESAASTLASISGDIVIRSITRADANNRLRLTGSTGQKFKVQSTADFNSWADRTDPLTLTADMEVNLPSIGNFLFFRTIRVD